MRRSPLATRSTGTFGGTASASPGGGASSLSSPGQVNGDFALPRKPSSKPHRPSPAPISLIPSSAFSRLLPTVPSATPPPVPIPPTLWCCDAAVCCSCLPFALSVFPFPTTFPVCLLIGCFVLSWLLASRAWSGWEAEDGSYAELAGRPFCVRMSAKATCLGLARASIFVVSCTSCKTFAVSGWPGCSICVRRVMLWLVGGGALPQRSAGLDIRQTGLCGGLRVKIRTSLFAPSCTLLVTACFNVCGTLSVWHCFFGCLIRSVCVAVIGHGCLVSNFSLGVCLLSTMFSCICRCWASEEQLL